jgi:hypothetical protein
MATLVTNRSGRRAGKFTVRWKNPDGTRQEKHFADLVSAETLCAAKHAEEDARGVLRRQYRDAVTRIINCISVDDNGCWIWRLRTEPEGYGRLTVDGKDGYLAHRFVYEQLVGPIPDGLHLDHLCRVRSCVNPEHLEPVTPQENLHRSWAGRREGTS